MFVFRNAMFLNLVRETNLFAENKLQTYSLLRLQVQNLILQQQMVKSPNHFRCLKQNVLILLIA